MCALAAVMATGIAAGEAANGEALQRALSEKYELPPIEVEGVEGSRITVKNPGDSLLHGETGVVFRASEGRKIGECVVDVAFSGQLALEMIRGRFPERGDRVYLGERRPPNPAFSGTFHGETGVSGVFSYTQRVSVSVDLARSTATWTVRAPFKEKPAEWRWRADRLGKPGERLTRADDESVALRLEGETLVFAQDGREIARLAKGEPPQPPALSDPWARRVWPSFSGWRRLDGRPQEHEYGEAPSRDPVSGLEAYLTGAGIGLRDLNGETVKTCRIDGSIGCLAFRPGGEWVAFWQRSRNADPFQQTGWKRLSLADGRMEDVAEAQGWKMPPLRLSESVMAGPGGHCQIGLWYEWLYPADGGIRVPHTFLCAREIQDPPVDGGEVVPPGRPWASRSASARDGKMIRLDRPEEWRRALPVALGLGASGQWMYGAVEQNGETNWWAADVVWTEHVPHKTLQPLIGAPVPLRDAFDNNANNWTTWKTERGNVTIQGGKLVVNSVVSAFSGSAELPRWYVDFACAVTAKNRGGASDTSFGLALHSVDEKVMTCFNVTDGGSWHVAAGVYRDKWEWRLVENGDGVPGGRFAEHRLRVVRKGARCVFEVNGQALVECEGPVGEVLPRLFAAAGGEGGACVVFDDFEITPETEPQQRVQADAARTGTFEEASAQAGSNAKDIFVAIVGANTERKPLGFGSVWPRSGFAPMRHGVDADIAETTFANSSDYFTVLLDGPRYGKAEWSPFVAGLDWPDFAGGGVPSMTGAGRLTAANNIWTVAADVTDDMPDVIPVLVSRNVDPASLIPEGDDLRTQRVRPSRVFASPFGGEGFVLIYKGGAVLRCEWKYANLHTLYRGQDARDIRAALQRIKYLTPDGQDGGDAPPALEAVIRPVYPIGARRRGEEGTVTLDVTVAASGCVVRVKIVKSSGFSELDLSAEQTVSKALFKPARRNGSPIESVASISLAFRLRDQRD
jgi:protein TonB